MSHLVLQANLAGLNTLALLSMFYFVPFLNFRTCHDTGLGYQDFGNITRLIPQKGCSTERPLISRQYQANVKPVISNSCSTIQVVFMRNLQPGLGVDHGFRIFGTSADGN